MAAPHTLFPCLGRWLILVAFGLRTYAAGGAQSGPPLVPESDPAPEVASRTDYRVDLWTTDQGLPQNTVQCLRQTQDGYLWVGTQSGLARFDGLHFTVFDRAIRVRLAHKGRRDPQGPKVHGGSAQNPHIDPGVISFLSPRP